jgi:DNA helicase-2/ATP-dependent DNA helicase PcrA
VTELNRQQELASRPVGGIQLVLAGAGTGKTKTLVEKVNNIIRSEIVKPEEILILTFSRKAAGEIKERVVSTLGEAAHAVTSGTFHSFSLKILREYGEPFLKGKGYSRFPGVITEEEKIDFYKKRITSSLDELCGIPAPVAMDLLFRKDTLAPGTVKKLYDTGIGQCLERIHKQYSEYKIENARIDFTDMANGAIELLHNESSIREKVRSRYRFILVDEYQDTSHDNYRLLRLLLPEERGNLFMVGDDWQSIYGFRGACVQYIIRIKKYFPDARVHKLEINYRSRKEIVDLSGRFIRKNRFQSGKRLRSFAGKGGRVRSLKVSNLEQEATVIKNILNERTGEGGTTAILVRNNWQLEYLEKRIDFSVLAGNIRPMTIHASKGLEFDTVIIGGLSDMIIPDRLSPLEEERRLFYVALTRAKENLFLITHFNGEVPPRFAREAKIA